MKRIVFITGLAVTILIAFNQFRPKTEIKDSLQSFTSSNEKGLKDYFSKYFPIGVAVSPRALQTDEAQLILKEFNSMTPENAMKMGPIHPVVSKF